MRKRYIQSEILFYLFDGNLHTAPELAEKIEVSIKTIRRHIQDLSINFPIMVENGGIGGGGGFRLEKDNRSVLLFTTEELNLILKALKFLTDEESRRLTKKIIHILELKKTGK